ncbi:hypothetical protein ACOMHN_021896 [Nucella lapillus]
MERDRRRRARQSSGLCHAHEHGHRYIATGAIAQGMPCMSCGPGGVGPDNDDDDSTPWKWKMFPRRMPSSLPPSQGTEGTCDELTNYYCPAKSGPV